MENETTIYHYGVKGMKWGVRRDFRVGGDNRRNKAIQEAKRDYKQGKTTKAERKAAIKKAKNYTKTFKKETREQYKNAKTRKERKELSKQIVKQAKEEVGLKRCEKDSDYFKQSSNSFYDFRNNRCFGGRICC